MLVNYDLKQLSNNISFKNLKKYYFLEIFKVRSSNE